MLQLRIVTWRSGAVMAMLGGRLVASSPSRPRQRTLGIVEAWPHDRDQQTTHFWLGERDHRPRPRKPIAPFFVASKASARTAARNERASIDSVTWRYQPVHERTSYSSSPASYNPIELAFSKLKQLLRSTSHREVERL